MNMSLFSAAPLSMILDDLSHLHPRASEAHRPNLTQPNYRTSSSSTGDMIEVELPGVDKSNVSLDVKGETLNIVAKRMTSHSETQVPGKPNGEDPEKDASPESGKHDAVQGNKVEVEYVARFNVGKRADTERVSANMSNGLLTVVVPAKAPKETEVRKITLE